LADVIASPLSQRLFKTFTDGPIRYRLAFAGGGHQRSVVRLLANRVFDACPDLLNDARGAPWLVSIYPADRGVSLELTPKLTPDPRFYYRREFVPAASFPPLAACLALLAGRANQDVVWDPFCGSGLELVERALRGGVCRIVGTDLRQAAIRIARDNFVAAQIRSVRAEFVCCDFREFASISGLGPNSVTLIITNPPMGRRVPIPDLERLIRDLFSIAAEVLRPGGRFVLVNPLRAHIPPPRLRLQFRETIDLGGFDGVLEKYARV
jgi:SAM-dependent methyltransferase